MKTKLKITETDIKKTVREYLSWKGWFHSHILQELGAFKGICDIIACKDGQVLFLEIKVKNGKQSLYQETFQSDIEWKGCKYILVRGIEDLKSVIG